MSHFADNTHAARLLEARFGRRMGEYLLWNETCFPMDGATALRQARQLIADHDATEALRSFALDPKP